MEENKRTATEDFENIVEEANEEIEKDLAEQAEEKPAAKKGKCPPISRRAFKIMWALTIIGMVVATILLVFAILGMFS